MNKKLNCILLIDDDESTNYLHRRLINKANCTHVLEIADDGKMALDYLAKAPVENPLPDIIFLDINMPVMSGWEFLERYEKLSPGQKAKTVVVMLTTSLNEDDKIRASNIPAINEFRNKPLTADVLKEIISKYFPGHM
jgi:CheY-like chemotaxis protein